MTKKPRKNPVGRPRTGRRPVIAIRVHEPLYNQICKSAAKHRLTISEEAERRLARSFDPTPSINVVQVSLNELKRAIGPRHVGGPL